MKVIKAAMAKRHIRSQQSLADMENKLDHEQIRQELEPLFIKASCGDQADCQSATADLKHKHSELENLCPPHIHP